MDLQGQGVIVTFHPLAPLSCLLAAGRPPTAPFLPSFPLRMPDPRSKPPCPSFIPRVCGCLPPCRASPGMNHAQARG